MRARNLFTRKGFRQSLKPRPRVPRQRKETSKSAPEGSASAPQGAALAVPPAALVERRDRLARGVAEQQWDLGGLVYEMARRDDFRVDVVIGRAARLQQLDAELADVERLMRLDQAGAEGACPSCGALYARGAVFCWQCGKALLERVTPAPKDAVAESVPPERQAATRPGSSRSSEQPTRQL